MKRNLFIIILAALLHPFAGCSGSDNNTAGSLRPETKASDMVVYEANPRIFAESNAFAAIQNDLDRIKNLGTTVLWLMPVNEPGVEKSVGSPYCIKDYKALNTRYGTEADLKKLVDAAHDRGLKVIIDWVANHTSWDNDWIKSHPEWYTHDAEGNIISPEGQSWSDVADLNYDNADMQTAMIDAMKYWITTAGIDGFRCDYAEGVPDGFWKKAIKELRSMKTDIIMLAEGGKATLADDGFNMVYGWDFQSKLKELYAGKATPSELYDVDKAELTGMPQGSLRLRYSTNHDQASEASPLQSYGGERGAMSAFVIATMLEGVPLIYSSQEAAYFEKLNFFDYKVIDLNARPDYAQEIASVISAYKATAGIRTGKLTTYSTGSVVCFYRGTGSKGLFVMVNTTGSSVEVKIPIEYARAVMTNAVTGGEIKLPVTMTMEPYRYLILTK